MKPILFAFFIFILAGCHTKHSNPVKIVSPVIKSAPFDSTKNRPSYCYPEKYFISEVTNGYMVLLPGGTVALEKVFATLQDAQIEINRKAKDSYETWIKSYGTQY